MSLIYEPYIAYATVRYLIWKNGIMKIVVLV